MIRRWQIEPDDEAGVMSRQALVNALVDGATMLDIAGGTLSVVVGRAATTLPGEMVMTGAVLEWRDRTDAKPQPEQAFSVTPEPEPAATTATPDEPAQDIDYAELPEEDLDEAEPARA